MEFWTDIISSPPVIIAALIIGTLGEVAKRIVLGRKGGKGPHTLWRRIYYVTLPAHPVIVGGLIGLIPWLPAAGPLEKEGYEFASRMGTYLLSGVLAKIGYDTMVGTIKRFIAQRAGATADGGSSEYPPEPPVEPASGEGEAGQS